MEITGAMKLIGAAAGVGLVGGFVAERMTSGDAIDRARDADRWNTLHEDFLKRYPAPEGTRVFVNSDPAWKNAALVGGAGLGAATLGGGLALAAFKMKPQNYPMFLGSVTLAALGGAAALGAGASWGLR